MILTMVLLLSALAASAQQSTWAVHTTDRVGAGSFISSAAQYVTLTNNVGITNLILNGSTGTNWTGTVYINPNGTRISTTASTYTNVNLLRAVPLWSQADGGLTVYSTNGLGGVGLNALSPASISLTVRAGAGSAAALTLIFAPVWDGVNVDTSGNSDFTWGFTPTASATRTIATNAPFFKWIGAKAVALKSISSADSTTTKAADILAVKLNGFGPP